MVITVDYRRPPLRRSADYLKEIRKATQRALLGDLEAAYDQLDRIAQTYPHAFEPWLLQRHDYATPTQVRAAYAPVKEAA